MDPSLCDPPVVSSFHFYRGEDTNEIVFLNKNHNLFVAKMNDDQMKLYIKTHNENPNFSWLWLGHGGKIGCKTCNLIKLVDFILSMSLKHLNTIQSVEGENGHVNPYVSMISIRLDGPMNSYVSMISIVLG